MFKGFRDFLLRGNVIDLAVAVVMGVAFNAVVAALVKDLVTPLIAAIVGKPDFSALNLTINGSRFSYGDFLNALISFVLVALAVYYAIVYPMNRLTARFKSKEPVTTRECPECLSTIPTGARRCAYCTSTLTA
ncbi:MAG TPA: large conductance mechanosensitive channel protein MscL [Candidatus Acidoferrales bacterium]|nr:large conductance mechanosensitive channel protein MscL [Candidatus Acidoferrales bacterium]